MERLYIVDPEDNSLHKKYLTLKEWKFATEYVNTGVKKKAYDYAGYSPKNIGGPSRVVNRFRVDAYIRDFLMVVSGKASEEILDEWRIG